VPKNLIRSDEESNTQRTGGIYAARPKYFFIKIEKNRKNDPFG
jgi:hypothetical protein